MNKVIGKLSPLSTSLFICDVQERFRSVISHMPSVIHVSKTMVRLRIAKVIFQNSVANELKMPVIVTEQYPKALGKTIPELDITKAHHWEKMTFSMVNTDILALLEKNQTKSVLLVGIEAHVCVLQTALDLLEKGYDVHVLADGVSSQRPSDRFTALERMKQSGAFITTSESAVFQLMTSANHPAFKCKSDI
jgi:isochorismate hydrolase